MSVTSISFSLSSSISPTTALHIAQDSRQMTAEFHCILQRLKHDSVHACGEATGAMHCCARHVSWRDLCGRAYMLSPRMTWRPDSGTSSTPACRAKRQLHEQAKHVTDDSSGEQQADVVNTLLENTLSWHSARMRFVI